MPRGLLDPRHGPGFDLRGGVPDRCLVVASTPRTGSTLLCRLLWATGRAGAPREYFNPVAIRDWAWRRAGPAGRAALASIPEVAVPVWAMGVSRDPGLRQAHLAAVWQARTSADGWWSTKLHAHHAAPWWDALARGRPVVVRVVRDDRVAQAISWARARRTGRWTARQRGRAWADRPDPAAVDRRLAAIEDGERWWDQRLGGAEVHVVRYEALRRDSAAAVRGVLAAMGWPDASRVWVPAPWEGRMADGRTALWRDAWRRARGQGSDLHRRL